MQRTLELNSAYNVESYDYTMCYMKAIGIICVVAGHSLTGSEIEHFVGLFHMPLFFFVSGYLFKAKYISSPKSFFGRRMKTLWWPTFKWIAIVVLLHNLFFSLGVYNQDYPYGDTITYEYSSIDYVKALLSAFFLRCNELLFAGLWFLRMLLVAYIICFLMIKFLNTRLRAILGGGILLVVVAVTLLLEYIGLIRIPYLPIYASFFFFAGFVWRKYFSEKYQASIVSPKIMVLFLMSLTIGVLFVNSSMLNVTVYTLLPYTLVALSGTFLAMAIGRNMVRQSKRTFFLRYFTYVGNHTYDILMMHIMSFKVVTLLLIIICGLNIQEIAYFPTHLVYAKKGWFLLYLLMGINLPLIFRNCYDTIKKRLKFTYAKDTNSSLNI